ncbi:transcription factor MYBS3-like [Phoenix dactylifera]|uniref:Transcription factor MYBS3-like n=1 Tax=Phoenix dactylifera TaxID=42345 RepID=A0A8B7C4B6_PHODC|nr:transcription factor MYBS3-like [Phoenix dactylifera]
MTRRCSHCSNNGHNSRTCPTRAGGVRLFGVRLTDGVGSMKKSASMGSLYSAGSSSIAGAGGGGGCSPNPGSPSNDPLRDHQVAAAGYASDDAAHASCSSNCRSERKKGVPWTEEEHRMFLLGLQKLGKGDWRGIARNFVVSRTPTQVASHAQKYFIRQTNASRRKRRSSLFDMVPEMPMDQLPVPEERFVHQSPNEPDNANQHPALNLYQDQEPELSEHFTKNNPPQELNETVPYGNNLMSVVPAFYLASIPMPYTFWPPDLNAPAKQETGEMHEIVKPTPVVPKEAVNMDEVAGMSKLSIGEHAAGRMEPSALSLKLLGASTSRQSAFHLNPSISRPDLSQGSSNAIHAV